LLFINIFNLQHCFLTGYVSWTWVEPNRIVCGDAHAEWRRQREVQQFVDNCAQHFVVCSFNHLFCKLLFSWIEYDDFFFNFQETYNSRLRERYGDDPSTHPDSNLDLWMEAESSGDPIKIGCTDSPTVQSITYGRHVVSQPLGASNQYRAPSLRRLWPWNNNINNSRRIMNNSASSSWT